MFLFISRELVWYHKRRQKPLVQQQMCENSLHVVRGERQQEQTGMFLICRVCFSLPSLTALQQLKTMHYLCACDSTPSLVEEGRRDAQTLDGSAASFNSN